MSLHLDATEEDFTTSIVLHPREISEEQVRRFEGYMAEIFQPFGMDMTDPGTALTTRRYIRALLVTTVKGLQHIHERVFPDWVQVRAVGEGTTSALRRSWTPCARFPSAKRSWWRAGHD